MNAADLPQALAEINITAYVPGTSDEAERIAKSVARSLGYSLTFNKRGDWLVRSAGKRFRGWLINVADCKTRGPCAVASRSVSDSLEPLRERVQDELLDHGLLTGAQS